MDKASSDSATFWDHLDALRSVLIRVLLFAGLLAACSFAAMPWIFDNVIMAPCSNTFPIYRIFDRISALMGTDTVGEFNVDVVSIELASQLFIHFSASCWTALIIGFPVILYLLWGFVAPALYPNERKGIRRAFLFGNIMFYLGVSVGYFLVFPLAVRFLSTYALSDHIRPIVSLDSYMDNFFTLLLMMGAVFELPLLAWLLGKMGLLTRSFFRSYRRHAVVVLLIVAAIITPTGDPFTLMLVFIPIYALWEASARLVPPDTPDNEDED